LWWRGACYAPETTRVKLYEGKDEVEKQRRRIKGTQLCCGEGDRILCELRGHLRQRTFRGASREKRENEDSRTGRSQNRHYTRAGTQDRKESKKRHVGRRKIPQVVIEPTNGDTEGKKGRKREYYPTRPLFREAAEGRAHTIGRARYIGG